MLPRSVSQGCAQAGWRRALETNETSESRVADGIHWLGQGSVGGKARSLGFLASTFDPDEWDARFGQHRFHVPDFAAIATGEFERFVSDNDLWQCIDIVDDDATVRERFLAGELREPLRQSLAAFLKHHHRPLAVRSSALHEDAFYQPLAGLFATYVLPNNAEEFAHRLHQLEDAVKLVFASTWYERPKGALERVGLAVESELMAVVLQELVGESYGDVFYPHVTGVVQSLNYFPVGAMKPEDGIALMVMGLGTRMVRGERTMRFCPAHPTIRPQMYTPRDMLRFTQHQVLAVDMTKGSVRLTGDSDQMIRSLELSDVDSQGTLRHLASTWVAQEQTLYPGVHRPGLRVLTFDGLLRGDPIPFPQMLRFLDERFSAWFNAPVVFKFALKLRAAPEGLRAHLFLLQVRPMVVETGSERVSIPEIPQDRIVLRSGRALGNGTRDDIRHIVFVSPEVFSQTSASALAASVHRINERLERAQHPYLLLGPGRWGSVNSSLGIPVTFDQVMGAGVMAELPLQGRLLTPSQGTHFFQNMAARGLVYLSVHPDASGPGEGDVFDREWIESLTDIGGEPSVRLLELDEPLHVVVDGRSREALLYRGER